MRAIEHSVHALCCVTSRRTAHFVIAIASTWAYKDAIRLLTVQCDWCTISCSQIIIAVSFRALEASWWSLREVVATTRLVVDDGDEASGVSAEFVLRCCISNTTSRQRCDVGGSAVRAALDLVEGAAEGAVQGAGGAVSSDARGIAGGVDIAGSSGNNRSRSRKA